MISQNQPEGEEEEVVDDYLESSRELRDCTENKYNSVIVPISTRTSSGRLVRLPKHFDDYVA